MKFLLLYSENKKHLFPNGKELKNEFKCSHVSDFKNLKKDLMKNEYWKLIDEEILHAFNFDFIEMNLDNINTIWTFDANRKYYNGKCKAYILSDDIDKRIIDWWSMKHNYSIRTFQCADFELKEAMEYLHLAYIIDNAHQYSTARHMREKIIEDYSNKLTNAQLTYLNKLTEQEDKIKLKFKTIQMDTIKKATKLLTKKL